MTTLTPQYRITVFSDFICPFCYIAFRRLLKLREELNLRIYWRLIEIHPDNPEAGKPIIELGYPDDQWQLMMENLSQLATAEDIEFAERTFTTNSKKALLLAEAAKRESSDLFYRISEGIFSAYFVDQKNIAQQKVLAELAGDAGMPIDNPEKIWTDQGLKGLVSGHQKSAAQGKITGTPTYLIGDQEIYGAVPINVLRQSIINHAVT